MRIATLLIDLLSFIFECPESFACNYCGGFVDFYAHVFGGERFCPDEIGVGRACRVFYLGGFVADCAAARRYDYVVGKQAVERFRVRLCYRVSPRLI